MDNTDNYKGVQLISYLEENYTLEEVENNYKEFNEEFFNGNYIIPSSFSGWAEQIEAEYANGYDLYEIL